MLRSYSTRGARAPGGTVHRLPRRCWRAAPRGFGSRHCGSRCERQRSLQPEKPAGRAAGVRRSCPRNLGDRLGAGPEHPRPMVMQVERVGKTWRVLESGREEKARPGGERRELHGRTMGAEVWAGEAGVRVQPLSAPGPEGGPWPPHPSGGTTWRCLDIVSPRSESSSSSVLPASPPSLSRRVSLLP